MAKGLSRTIITVMLLIFVIPIASIAKTEQDLIKIADEYLISRVGEEYFNQYFSFRFISSAPDKDRPLPEPKTRQYICYFHKIVIGLEQPESGYDLDRPVYVLLESADEGWEAIESNAPACLQGAKNCNPFKITKREAIRIAEEVTAEEAPEVEPALYDERGMESIQNFGLRMYMEDPLTTANLGKIFVK